jgi:hypothetical protein
MGSRCVLHHTRRLAGRRRIYATPWYKKFEDTFVRALEVRFDLEELPTTAEQFVHAILPPRLHRKHTAALVEIVTAVDRRAHADHGSTQEE